MDKESNRREAERYLAKAKAWLPDENDGETQWRRKAMMCDLNSRIALVHAELSKN